MQKPELCCNGDTHNNCIIKMTESTAMEYKYSSRESDMSFLKHLNSRIFCILFLVSEGWKSESFTKWHDLQEKMEAIWCTCSKRSWYKNASRAASEWHLSEEPRLVAVFLVLNIEPGDPQERCFECPRPSSFLSSNESWSISHFISLFTALSRPREARSNCKKPDNRSRSAVNTFFHLYITSKGIFFHSLWWLRRLRMRGNSWRNVRNRLTAWEIDSIEPQIPWGWQLFSLGHPFVLCRFR